MNKMMSYTSHELDKTATGSGMGLNISVFAGMSKSFGLSYTQSTAALDFTSSNEAITDIPK